MTGKKGRSIIVLFAFFIALTGVLAPIRAQGDVKPITDVEDKLKGITEEEKAVLEELFSINQKIEELEVQKEEINKEIESKKKQLHTLEGEIADKQETYDRQLAVLQQVLVDYQKGGPSTYLEILLKADNLSDFLKSLNVIKDISHNVKELLKTLEKGKKELLKEKEKLAAKAAELEEKQFELTQNLQKNQKLQEDKKTYLASLQENEAYYKEKLGDLETMWEKCKTLYPKLAKKITDTINEGYFTWEDLHMQGLVKMNGYIEQTTFNGILQKNSDLSETEFLFQNQQVVLKVPEENLSLTGYFKISEPCAIQFEVTEGTFYDLPLEKVSLEELFQNGPMLIDFNAISEGMIAVKFTINKVESGERKLAFELTPDWSQQ